MAVTTVMEGLDLLSVSNSSESAVDHECLSSGFVEEGAGITKLQRESRTYLQTPSRV